MTAWRTLVAEVGRRARRAWVRLDKYRRTQVRDATLLASTPYVVNAICRVCGQEEGPFCDVTEARRVLELYGWLHRLPAEAWRDGHWDFDVPTEWWCPHCRPLWEHERCKRQGVTYGSPALGLWYGQPVSQHRIGPRLRHG